MNKKIKIDEIVLDKTLWSRGKFDKRYIKMLKKNINEKGLMTPIVVQLYDKIIDKKYRLLSGWNRVQACKELEHETILTEIRTDLDTLEIESFNLKDNLTREVLK
jgi:ParB-like chromosome segregation protein Spo0J